MRNMEITHVLRKVTSQTQNDYCKNILFFFNTANVVTTTPPLPLFPGYVTGVFIQNKYSFNFDTRKRK